MKEKIDQLILEAEQFAISTKDHLDQFKLKFLVKKGLVNQLFQEFKKLSSEEKKSLGKNLNLAKQKVEGIFKKYEADINSSSESTIEKEADLPGYFSELGSRHPINFVIEEMTQIFERLGFSVATGPEVEDDWHNFSALNFPQNHPARDMQDTFFVEEDIALRTHTSSVQVRLMEEGNLPIRSIMQPTQ